MGIEPADLGLDDDSWGVGRCLDDDNEIPHEYVNRIVSVKDCDDLC